MLAEQVERLKTVARRDNLVLVAEIIRQEVAHVVGVLDDKKGIFVEGGVRKVFVKRGGWSVEGDMFCGSIRAWSILLPLFSFLFPLSTFLIPRLCLY